MSTLRDRRGLFNALVAGLVLVLIAPAFAFVALVVGLACGRPVLTRTPYLGRQGMRFDRLTFRTDPSHRGHQLLRQTGLEQLPVLVNIARGELRWIGPAPTPADAVPSHDPSSLPAPGVLRAAA